MFIYLSLSIYIYIIYIYIYIYILLRRCFVLALPHLVYLTLASVGTQRILKPATYVLYVIMLLIILYKTTTTNTNTNNNNITASRLS